MIFISRRATAIRPMHEARARGQLEMDDHFNRVGALRELRSITQLSLMPAVELIDKVIAGEKVEIEALSPYGRILELPRFVKVMDGHGFTITDDFVELDDTDYFVAVDEEPADDLRLEIERRIFLLIRSRNEYNQSCGYPPCNIPNLIPMSDMEVLDYFAGLITVNSIPVG